MCSHEKNCRFHKEGAVAENKHMQQDCSAVRGAWSTSTYTNPIETKYHLLHTYVIRYKKNVLLVRSNSKGCLGNSKYVQYVQIVRYVQYVQYVHNVLSSMYSLYRSHGMYSMYKMYTMYSMYSMHTCTYVFINTHTRYTKCIGKYWTSFWSPIGSKWRLGTKRDHFSHGVTFRAYWVFSKLSRDIRY